MSDARSDPLYADACRVVRQQKRAAISTVQRHLAIGYNRAARLLDAMVGDVIAEMPPTTKLLPARGIDSPEGGETLCGSTAKPQEPGPKDAPKPLAQGDAPIPEAAVAAVPVEQQLRIQIRQADERGDEAMRRAHAWEAVACESGDWLPDQDGFPWPSASRIAKEAVPVGEALRKAAQQALDALCHEQGAYHDPIQHVDEAIESLRTALAAVREAPQQPKQPLGDTAEAPAQAPACSSDEIEQSAPWARNDELTRDILQLVGFSPLPETMAAWTDEQAQQAEEWAGAVHLHASDNDDVIVPPKPVFLPAPWKGDGDDIWGPGPTKF